MKRIRLRTFLIFTIFIFLVIFFFALRNEKNDDNDDKPEKIGRTLTKSKDSRDDPDSRRSAAWRRLLRKSRDREIAFLLLPEEKGDAVDAVDAAADDAAVDAAEDLPETIVDSFSNLIIFDRDVTRFADVVDSETSSTNVDLSVALIRGDARTGALAAKLQPASIADAVKSAMAATSPTLFGFSIFDSSSFPLRISILYLHYADNADDDYAGYWFVPWTRRGRPVAFDRIETAPVKVAGFHGAFLAPKNASQFRWSMGVAEFVECDGEEWGEEEWEDARAMAKMHRKRTMKIVVALRRTLSSWQRRSVLYGATLANWRRFCSLPPYVLTAEVAVPLRNSDDLTVEYFSRHPLLRLQERAVRKGSASGSGSGNGQGSGNGSVVFTLGDRKWYTVELVWLNGTNDGEVATSPFSRVCSADLHGHLVHVPCDGGGDQWMQLG